MKDGRKINKYEENSFNNNYRCYYQSTYCQDIKDRYRLMFYNVENLFDTIDDPNTADDEFTQKAQEPDRL